MTHRLPESSSASEEPSIKCSVNGRHHYSTQSKTSSISQEHTQHSGTIHKANSIKPIPTKDSIDANSLECTATNTANTRSKLTNGDQSVNGVVENTLFKVGKTQVEGLVMRNGRGPLLRHRPYTVNNKPTTEPS